MGNKTKDPECVCTNEEYADAMFTFGIVDKVRVPSDLPPGDYVLSWRWDCEQTKQIWSSCGDVTVHAADAPDAKATVPFSAQRGCTACSTPHETLPHIASLLPRIQEPCIKCIARASRVYNSLQRNCWLPHHPMLADCNSPFGSERHDGKPNSICKPAERVVQ